MLENDLYDDIARMYRLFSKVSNGLSELQSALGSYIRVLGSAINESVGGVRSIMNAELRHKSIKTVPLNDQNEEDVLMSSESPPTRRLSKNIASSVSVISPTTTNTTSTSTISPIKWAEELLLLRNKFDLILAKSFSGDKDFLNTMNAGFGWVINVNPRGAEFVSLFIDDNLRKGIKGVCFFFIIFLFSFFCMSIFWEIEFFF